MFFKDQTETNILIVISKSIILAEYWGYRTIKLKLNYNLPHKQRMMIIGSIPELGSWKLPVVMKNQ